MWKTKLVRAMSKTETEKFIKREANIVDIKNEWILFKWRKSLWKNVWKELLCYTILFILLNIITNYGFSNKLEMEQFIRYVREIKGSSKHLTFILGLYIGIVVKRWWDQYRCLPWPDELALHLQACVVDLEDDEDEKGRQVRRTIIRYSLASYILAIRTQSSQVRGKYPFLRKLVQEGILETDELSKICEDGTCLDGGQHTSRWWVPLQWSMKILTNARREGLIQTGPEYTSLVSSIKDFKYKLEMLKAYGSNPLPLIYSQVVSLAVYVYLFLALITDLCIDSGDDHTTGDFFCFPWNIFPLMFKFLFYYGLLSVATSLYNPWGCDDEDFQLNDILNHHLKVAMDIVDGTNSAPELRKDKLWRKDDPEIFQKNTDLNVGGV